MAKSTDFDKTHRRNLAAIGTRIDRIFKKATEEAAKIGVNIKSPLPEDRIFSFDDYPETEKQIKRLLAALQDSMDVVIANGVRSGWNLANNKNDALCHRVFGDNVGKLTKEQYKRYFSTNGEALDAFLQRKTNGLNLSDRVWRYTQSFKREIEMGLDLGIRTGSPSAKMARDLKQYLQHPDKLFRRVRDKHGILRLSQAAREFHPGRGVYRSSYKNALRLAITETNIAYHTADHLRWQQMDFVVGIEIRLSGNHTIENAKGQAIRLTDICDELAGKYPKDFKFVGWHPHCRCQAISILKTEKEMEEDTQRILDGKAPMKGSVNAVEGVPAAFSDWVEAHSDRIVQGGNLPNFLRDNKRRVDAILGMSDNPNVAIKVKVGDKEYTLKGLIAECRVEPSENGKIYVHPNHGKTELQENLEFARWRAEQFGEEVVLLPNPQHIKSADSYNITRGVVEEFKRCHQPTINAVSQEIRKGLKQAKHIIIEPNEDMSVENMMKAVTSRISNGNYPRSQSLVELRIKIGDYEATYSRADIISKGFKIKPGDFHNVSVSRSQGSSLTSSAGSISDAKLSKFFGLNKKTPQEIAAERHAKRTAADVERIQTDWNQSRSSNVLIEHLQKFGDLEWHYGGKLDESSAYKHWERLTTEQRLNVLAKGRFTGMLSSEEDLDFCNLYLKSDKEGMTGILQEKLENVRYGYNMEDENHYVFHFKNGKKIFFSEDLDKPLSKRDLERLDWVSANSGLSNYRYWCVDEKAKADMMQQMGFIEYRNGRIVASWNGKDYLGNEIEDKYIGQGIIEKGKDFIISKRFARLNTHDEVATTLSELLGKRLGYEVEVDVNKDLIDLATAKGYATELERLSRQYMLKQGSLSKVVLGYTPSEPMEFGSVFYNPKESTKKTLSLRKALEERFPDKAINSSRCERKHITRSIATHEFGHLLYQFREDTNGDVLFEANIRNIYNEYTHELNKLVKQNDYENAAPIFIGSYGHNKINDFIAECFQEYINCKRPTKYALEVGELIDKWFKKINSSH